MNESLFAMDKQTLSKLLNNIDSPDRSAEIQFKIIIQTKHNNTEADE